MAKHGVQISGTKTVTINDLISKIKADDMPDEVYSNFVQFLISGNEVYIDFYQVSPVPGAKTLAVKMMQRVILPINMAKGTVTALANAIAAHEQNGGEILPNTRPTDPDDKIVIWS